MSNRSKLAIMAVTGAVVIMAALLNSRDRAVLAEIKGPGNVATAEKPAEINIKIPAAKAAPKALKLTVRPEIVDANDRYIVNVYALKQGKAGGDLVGSFSFFPPPKPNETRTFTLPAPAASENGELSLKVEIVPVEGDAKKSRSELAVLDATIVE